MDEQGRVLGRYRIDRSLGEGGMGSVFLATDQALGRRVALKVLPRYLAADPVFRARFEREAQALARLSSPHVTSIYDVGEHQGSLYLATQYVAGGDLVDLLTAGGPMSPREALRLCAQVCDALADAHAVGVVHRDVKPGNVLIEQDPAGRPTAVLCDFGICQTDATSRLTTVGFVAGSWEYLAPERLAGAPAGVASDLYSVGCLLWACVAGRPPFLGTDDEIAEAHLHAPVPTLPAADRAGAGIDIDQFNRVLARLLAKHPARRYATATIARDDLLYAARDDTSATTATPARVDAAGTAVPATVTPGTAQPPPVSAAPVPSPPHAWRPTTPLTRRWVLPAVATAVAALVGIATVAVAGAGDGDRSPTARSDDPLGRAGAGSESATGGDSTDGTTDGSEEDAGPTTDERSGGDGPGVAHGPVVLVADGPGVTMLAVRDGALVPIGEPAPGSTADRQLLVDGELWEADLDGRQILLQRPGREVSRLRLPAEVVDLAVGDVTGDGLPDLVIAGTAGVYVAKAAGRQITQPARWLGDWVGADRLAVGDLDGDGIDDLARWSGDSLSPELALHRSTGRAFTGLATVDRLELARAGRLDATGMIAADVDGDGRDEIALVGHGTPLTVIDPDDRGADPRLTTTAPTTDPPWQIAAGDLESDGADGGDELVVLRPAGAGVELALADADGAPGTWTPLACAEECRVVGVLEERSAEHPGQAQRGLSSETVDS